MPLEWNPVRLSARDIYLVLRQSKINNNAAKCNKFPFIVRKTLVALGRKQLQFFQFKYLFNRFQGLCFFFLFSLNPADVRVRVNAVMWGVMGDLYDVLNYTLHPEYNHETLDYDMAVLQVNKTTLAVTTFM
jgi:hypothetical protein